MRMFTTHFTDVEIEVFSLPMCQVLFQAIPLCPHHNPMK